MNLGYSVLEAASNNQISRKGLPKFRAKRSEISKVLYFKPFQRLYVPKNKIFKSRLCPFYREKAV